MTATDRPFTAALDIGKMIEGLRTLERLAASPEHIVPGHDPRVMTRCHVRGSRRARRRDAEAGLGALMGVVPQTTKANGVLRGRREALTGKEPPK